MSEIANYLTNFKDEFLKFVKIRNVINLTLICCTMKRMHALASHIVQQITQIYLPNVTRDGGNENV